MQDEFKKEEQDGKVRDNLSEFLNKLEMEAEEGNRPILVIREAQKLVDESLPMETKRVFKALLQCFESYSDGKKNVSIIIESSEYTLANLRQYIISLPQSFQLCQVKPWSKDVGYQELVERYQVFTAEEYERVWDTVGGHAGQLFSLHSYLRLGWNLNQAIESMNSELPTPCFVGLPIELAIQHSGGGGEVLCALPFSSGAGIYYFAWSRTISLC